MKTWIASIATIAATIGILPGQARADHRAVDGLATRTAEPAARALVRSGYLPDIDELACLLRDQAAGACYEIRYHFSGAPNYRHLYADTYELYRQAERIHDLVHSQAPLAEVAASVDELDELFHHVEEVIADVEPGIGARGIGRTSGYLHAAHGRSRFSSYHFRRLQAQLAGMNDTIHSLGEAVTAVRGPLPGRGVERPLPPEALPGSVPADRRLAPAAPVEIDRGVLPSAGRSIRFGNGKDLQFTLRLGR